MSKVKKAEEDLEQVISEQEQLAEEIKAAEEKARAEIRAKKEAEAREAERRRLEVERIERERKLAEIEKEEYEKKAEAARQKLEALEVPDGYTLCTIKEEVQSGSDYIVIIKGQTFKFKPPKYLCALPEDLAAMYDSTNHPIMIKP